MTLHTQLILIFLITFNLCIIEGGHARCRQEKIERDLKPYVGRVDPGFLCEMLKCYSPVGSWCRVVKDGDVLTPKCVCPTTCPRQGAPVCSVVGKTYHNECLLHKEACRKKRRIGKAHDGPCLEVGECTELELDQFPFRLLDWFLLISRMGKSFTSVPTPSCISHTHRVQLAQSWFSMMDADGDGKLKMKDLKKLHYKKIPLEHCARTFFQSCDSNRNKKVTLSEWTSCLVDRSERWFQKFMSVKMDSTKLCHRKRQNSRTDLNTQNHTE